MGMKEWTTESGGGVEYFLDHTPSDGGATMSLGVDKGTGELYVNGKKVVTEQTIKLEGWVRVALIIGGFSTGFMFIVQLFNLYQNGG